MLHFSLLFLLMIWVQVISGQCVPVASFPFNGNANDVSGNGNHGVLGGEINNPVLTTDRFGNPNSATLQFGSSIPHNSVCVGGLVLFAWNKKSEKKSGKPAHLKKAKRKPNIYAL